MSIIRKRCERKAKTRDKDRKDRGERKHVPEMKGKRRKTQYRGEE
jgi:hypothetical protein